MGGSWDGYREGSGLDSTLDSVFMGVSSSIDRLYNGR